jgi:hypothetical protein
MQITDVLAFPLDAITEPMALLAMRGAGKSNAAVVLAEAFYDAGLPWVAIDPKGDWWGIRSSADGKNPGLPIPVFGGLHGHIPLEPTAGAVMADTVVSLNLTCVLDVSTFTKGEQTRFLTDFGEHLFKLQGATPHPRHLFFEECDEYIPQRVTANMARCVGIWTKIVKQGRHRGLGVTLISQRSAVVNKDALTQVETLMVLRNTSPQDRKAILGWVEYHAVGRELVDSLPTLANGEAWVISPHWLKKIQRVRFCQRRTFDSGATPKHGKIRQPATMADVDLSSLQKAMAATIERAEAKDPTKLRARVAELEGEVARLEAQVAHLKASPTVVEKEVEVRVPEPASRAVLDKLVVIIREGVTEALEVIDSEITRLESLQKPFDAQTPRVVVPQPVLDAVARKAPSPPPPALIMDGVSKKLSKAEKAVLSVLAQYPQGRSKSQVALLTGYAGGGGGFLNALGALRSMGFITKGDPITITPEGEAAITGLWEPLPTGAELREHWKSKGGKGGIGKAGAAILDALAAVWPNSMTKEELANVTGYAVGGGGFLNALGRLRTLGLVERGDPRLADELAG